MKKLLYPAFLFFVTSGLGWGWEACVFRLGHPETGWLEILTGLRGFLYGPWVPIYGVGSLLVLGVAARLRAHPARLFGGIVAACGVLEYTVSYLLERIFHARWWDYSGCAWNLNGRISLAGLLAFGLLGMALVYGMEPWLRRCFGALPLPVLQVLVAGLTLLFVQDLACAIPSPNLGLGVLTVG